MSKEGSLYNKYTLVSLELSQNLQRRQNCLILKELGGKEPYTCCTYIYTCFISHKRQLTKQVNPKSYGMLLQNETV